MDTLSPFFWEKYPNTHTLLPSDLTFEVFLFLKTDKTIDYIGLWILSRPVYLPWVIYKQLTYMYIIIISIDTR